MVAWIPYSDVFKVTRLMHKPDGNMPRKHLRLEDHCDHENHALLPRALVAVTRRNPTHLNKEARSRKPFLVS